MVFAGGLTGGHLFPGLAVADEITALAPGTRIEFTGLGTAFDRDTVARAGYEYVTIASPRMPRSIGQGARFTFDMLRGYRAAAAYLRRSRASVVIGLGGFASVPTALAAARLRRPLVLLEQNAVVGRANRRLARLARYLCAGFDETCLSADSRALSIGCPVVATGTPVRAQFLAAKSADDLRPTLLILGGTSGARLLNESVPAALSAMPEALAGWRVVHQTGRADVAATAAAYAAARIEATIAPFFDDLPAILARTGLAICRAGGSTLAELAVMGVPAILVPLAGATDDHQTRNALMLSDARAAVTIRGNARQASFGSHSASAQPIAEILKATLTDLLADSRRRMAMSAAIRRFARPEAATHIARLALSFADGGRARPSPGPAIFPRLPVLH
jgi:UDP-N-acetylglucosamine--N-acetylmuramyl-(pentapeptide) pyrophosphoryl-undecaprenol N-acetylglucosamine transferase